MANFSSKLKALVQNNHISTILLVIVLFYIGYNLIQQLRGTGDTLNPAEIITIVAVIITFLLEWRYSLRNGFSNLDALAKEVRESRVGIDLLNNLVLDIKKSRLGSDGFLVRRNELPSLRDRIENTRRQSGSSEVTIAAYGPSLNGLLRSHKDLFLEHLNNNGKLLFALLSPASPQPRFETSPWDEEGGLISAINESIQILKKLETGRHAGVIEYKILEKLPDGSMLILDLDGPFEQVQYQIDIAGCPTDLLPIMISEKPTYIHQTLKKSWESVWHKGD